MLSNFTAEQLIWSGSPLLSTVLFSMIVGLVKATKNNRYKNFIELDVSYLHIYSFSETWCFTSIQNPSAYDIMFTTEFFFLIKSSNKI